MTCKIAQGIRLVDNWQLALFKPHARCINWLRRHLGIILFHLIIFVQLVICIVVIFAWRTGHDAAELSLDFGCVFSLSFLELLQAILEHDLVDGVQLGLG